MHENILKSFQAERQILGGKSDTPDESRGELKKSLVRTGAGSRAHFFRITAGIPSSLYSLWGSSLEMIAETISYSWGSIPGEKSYTPDDLREELKKNLPAKYSTLSAHLKDWRIREKKFKIQE